MLLSVALFALFMTGFWLYCLTDAILTSATECRGLPKSAWIAIITLTFVCGAIAWLIVRSPARSSSVPVPPWDTDDAGNSDFPVERWTDADDAVARHPAGRSRVSDPARTTPKGPDDDPEFLRMLARAIRGSSEAGEEV